MLSGGLANLAKGASLAGKVGKGFKDINIADKFQDALKQNILLSNK